MSEIYYIMFEKKKWTCPLSNTDHNTCHKVPGNYLETTWKIPSKRIFLINQFSNKSSIICTFSHWNLHGHVPCQIQTLLSVAKYLETTWKIHGKYLENGYFKWLRTKAQLFVFLTLISKIDMSLAKYRS